MCELKVQEDMVSGKDFAEAEAAVLLEEFCWADL